MPEYKYLNRINSPADLKCLREDDLAPLAQEIREFLVEKVEKNGGHLASNLGVVELTLAIHRAFDIPSDHLIFDVSHQSYVHKIITGRKSDFDKLRQADGISGFMKRRESESDCFGAGHSSTSLSAGLGFAQADRIKGSGAYTVVVFGDGAFTGGMIHEALNNIDRNLRLIIVLNENEMSISKNIGSFARILTKLRLRPWYVKFKRITKKTISAIPLVGKPLFKAAQSLKMRVKDIFYGSNYFENMGLFYVGPVDGNDEKQVEDALRIAKSCNESAIVHVKTVKGKGYAPAEQNPAKYHGIAPANAKKAESSFSYELGKYICELAEADKDVCAITAAMPDGTGLSGFSKAYPDRFFDVGIAEEHALTFACGLAAEGLKPYFAVYSTFLQRSYDNIIHDMALQSLPVKLCIDRTGLNYSDGATHHGIYDVAMLGAVPNITLYTPVTYDTLKRSLDEMNKCDTPCAVRYPRGEENEIIKAHFYKGKSKPLSVKADFDGNDMLDAIIVTHGQIAAEAIKAQSILKNRGIRAGLILCERIMPYTSLAQDVAELLPRQSVKIVALEEEIRAGGFSMMLLDKLSRFNVMNNKKTAAIALDGTLADTYGEDIYSSFGLDADSIVSTIINM